MFNLRSLIAGLREKHDFKTLLFHSSWSLTLTSGLSYFLGFIRDRIFAQTYGLSRTMDIYNAAFVIPENLLSILIGTMLSAAFLPIFTQKYDQNKALGYRYVHQIMSWGLLTVSIIAIGIAITLPFFAHRMVPGFEPEAVKEYILLTRILLLSPLLFTLSNIYGKVLISFHEFLWYGLSPALYNVGIIFGALVLAPKLGNVGLMCGVLSGILLHLLARLINLKRKKHEFTHGFDLTLSPEIKETIKLTAPKILQYGMAALLLSQFTSITSTLGEGAIAAYNYARNFQSIPVSLLGIAISLALYPTLSHDAGKGNFEKFKNDFKRGRMKSIVYTTLAALLLALLSKQLVGLLLGGGKFGESEIMLVATVLQVYTISVPFESLLHTYHRAYYSLRNTLVPSLLHAVIILGTIILAKILTPTVGVYAIPISFASGLIVQIFLLSLIFPFVLKQRENAHAQSQIQ